LATKCCFHQTVENDKGEKKVARQEATASVIVEWYNMTHAEHSRATRMLAELISQAASLYSPDERKPGRLAKPLDLVIVFDSEQESLQNVQSAFGNLANAMGSVVPRLLPIPDARYCKLKNSGAASSKSEIIIFLDCDVIPEPNWLAAFLEAFADPRVSVVVGNTYVDCNGPEVYPKAMALSWMFPLRDANDRLSLSTWFYANNVAFRREAFVSRQFADVPGLTHAPARLFVERLRREGVAIWHAGNARASHPPPNGSVHFVMRAIAGGKARAFFEPRPNIVGMIRWIRNDLGSITWGCKQIVLSGSKVELRWWQVPLAVVYPAAYYTLFCLGSFLSVMLPGVMRDRFDL
jgi:glycosyltransferase involved in cell wall biosynthesis